MKTIVIFTFLTISLLLSIPQISSQEVDDETDFSYEQGSENGPDHWGELHANWSKCGTGHQQSPIDLLNERVQMNPFLGRLFRSYRPADATMKNRGHDIELKLKDPGSILINGKQYFLTQMHWHSPSEHTINGKRFEMEMHMVHLTQDGKNIAVIGFLYEYGHPDPLLTELEPYIKEVANKKHEEETSVGIFDPRKIKLGSRKYYRYMGSLTVPPCTEGVVWTIVKKIKTVSKDQLELLKESVHDHAHDNARPVQSLYDRMINMYRPLKV